MKFLQGFFKKIFPGENASGYAYTNTRVRVMKSKLLQKPDFQKLMKMSVEEIARYLEETEYKKEIDSLALDYAGANLIEAGLNKNMEQTFKKINNFSMKASRLQIQLYLNRFDIQCIKTILRGKNAKAGDAEISRNLVVAGKYSRNFFEEIIKNAKTSDEAIAFFRETEYYPVLKKFSKNLSKLEDELDKYYYGSAVLHSEKQLNDFIKFEINALNSVNSLRAKKSSVKLDLLPNGKLGGKNVLKTENPLEAEKFLKRQLNEMGILMLNKFRRDIGPVLAYFVAKQCEIDNIRIIVRGKHVGLDEKIIEEQLVIA